MTKRKSVVYLPPGIYPTTILHGLYPGRDIVITPDGKAPKRKLSHPKKASRE